MINEIENPFSVTKATEFSDEEINEYWVSFNAQEDNAASILNTSEFLPKYIIGGKGCGKTHILRYFSYPLQKIRHKFNIQEIINEDKYIGLYSVFHGMNSSRFEGKGINPEVWKTIFEYYFELYLSDNLLQTVQEIFRNLDLDTEKEADVVNKIVRQFNVYEEISTATRISELLEILTTFRRKIDAQILNAAFTRELNFEEVKVTFSPGDLIFGIPLIISLTIHN